MEPTCTEDMLRETAQLILEEAAFVFTEPVEEPSPWEETPVLGRIAFRGPRPGTLYAAATADFCMGLAANLLGDEVENLSLEAEGLGALGETLNMMCGSLTTKMFGDQEVCELGIPETGNAVEGDAASVWDRADCRISLETDEAQRMDLLVLFT